jgi:hypothetical protein
MNSAAVASSTFFVRKKTGIYSWTEMKVQVGNVPSLCIKE